MGDGPGAGLDLLEAITAAGALSDYHLLHAVRGDLLACLGRDREAATSFLQAAQLTANTAEQHFHRKRANEPRRTTPVHPTPLLRAPPCSSEFALHDAPVSAHSEAVGEARQMRAGTRMQVRFRGQRGGARGP
jgi:hypothetical protein